MAEHGTERGPRVGSARVVGFLIAATAAAQTPAPESAPKRRAFDSVVAIIGDQVILQSTIRKELAASNDGQPLSPEEAGIQSRALIRRIAAEEQWIQYGKAVGQAAPEEFERTVDRMVSDYMDQRQRESGSFTRLNEDLGIAGTSWDTIREEYRNGLLESLAKQNLLSNRFRDSVGLVVTPLEMRRHYDAHREDFRQEASADVAWVGFELAGDADAVRTRATEAAAAWRTEGSSSTAIAQRFGGVDGGVQQAIRQTEKDPRADYLKAFASTAALGDVSEPIARGRTLAVLKIVAVTPAREEAFASPEVQARIREGLAHQLQMAWVERVLALKRRNVFVWPPWLAPGQ